MEKTSIGQMVSANKNSMLAFFWPEAQPADDSDEPVVHMASGITSELMDMERKEALALLRTELELPLDTRGLIMKLEHEVEWLETHAQSQKQSETMLQLEAQELMGRIQQSTEAMQKRQNAWNSIEQQLRRRSAENEKELQCQDKAIQEDRQRLDQRYKAIEQELFRHDQLYAAGQQQLQAVKKIQQYDEA